jgi:hypothetical protein
VHLTLTRRWTAIILAVCASVAGAGDVKFVPREVVSLEKLQLQFSRTSGKHEVWNILRLTPVDKKRFLVLLAHERYRVSPWTDSGTVKKEREKNQGLVRSVVFEDSEEKVVLGLLRRDGKILALADEPTAAERHLAFYPGAHDLPLVFDERDTCPYAILAPGSSALLCYDLDLRFLAEHKLPLHEIGYPKVTFDGVEYTLWLFGRKYATPPKPLRSFGDASAAPPEVAEEFGIRYRLRDHSVEPIPIDRQELLARMNRLARGPDGQRLHINPAGVSVVPFRDLDNDAPFWVLIEGVATTQVRSRQVLHGTRVFFRARLDALGLGPLQQLPLWMVQEEREDLVIDEDHGVLYFPPSLREQDLQPYSLGKNDLVLWLQLAFARPREDGTVPRTKELLQTLAVFQGTADPPQWLHLDVDPALKERWRQKLSTSELEVWPLFLLDRVGRSSFAFDSSCEPKRGNEVPCFSLMDLEY